MDNHATGNILHFQQLGLHLLSFPILTIESWWLNHIEFTLKYVCLGYSPFPSNIRHTWGCSLYLNLHDFFWWNALENDGVYSCFLTAYHFHDHLLCYEILMLILVCNYFISWCQSPCEITSISYLGFELSLLETS
jgi:hypothetical protein